MEGRREREGGREEGKGRERERGGGGEREGGKERGGREGGREGEREDEEKERERIGQYISAQSVFEHRKGGGGEMGVAYLNKVLDGSSHGSDWPCQVLNDLPLLCFFMEDNQLGHLRLKGRTVQGCVISW